MKTAEKKPNMKASVEAPSLEKVEHAAEIPGQKRKRQPWEISKGWRSVDVGDGLLVGAAEGGFCGLEEFSPSEGMIQEWTSAAACHEPAIELLEKEKEKESAKTTKKGAAKKKGKAKEKAEQDDSAKELQQQLAAAEAEAKRLRALVGSKATPKKRKLEGKQKQAAGVEAKDTSPGPGFPTEDAVSGEGEKALNHKDRKRLQRAAYKAAKRMELKKGKAAVRKAEKKAQAEAKPAPAKGAGVDEAGDAQEEEIQVDVSNWKPYDLDPLIEGALSKIGFSTPTPIQQECLLPAIRDRRDIIGAAQTGSGKTLAFGLPMLQALMEERRAREFADSLSEGGQGEAARHLRGLVLAPTRELAMQVSEHLQAIAKPCGIWVVPIVGGIAIEKQQRYLRSTPEVVVATPGRLWELMRDGAAHLTDMSHLSFLVLDEADRMVQQGHYEELSSILEFVPSTKEDSGMGAAAEGSEGGEPSEPRAKKRKLQTFVFSATLTLPESLRRRLKRGGGGASGSVTLENLMEKMSFGHKPKIADLTSARRLADKVTEAYLECTEDDRDERLYYLLTQHPGRTLVFANAISMVRRLAAILKLLQLPVTAMHSSMQQRQRLKALERFRNSDSAVLVATDVAARGLDIPEVACVVHYQIPAAADVYVHRCGRTGRAAAEGISVALVAPKESVRFDALMRAMGRGTPPTFPLDYNLLPGARRRIRLALRLDEQLRSTSKKAAEQSWEQQMAEAAGIELSDEEVGDGEGEAEVETKSTSSRALQQELGRLLQEPLQPKYSQRFFAGRPSAALAGSGNAKGEEEGAEVDPQAVSQAVAHATNLAEARNVGATATAAKLKKQQQKKKRRQAPENLRKKALADAVNKQISKKKDKGATKGAGPVGKSRFVVIPGAVGRKSVGPNALEALRHKLAASK